MPEYRPVPDADVDAFRRVLDYAFRADAGPDPEPVGDEEADPGAVVERRAVYVDDRPVSTAAHHRFEATVRGAWLDVAGLGGVATLPEARHRGHVRTLLRESLAEYRAWDRPLAILWPFEHAFYRRFGWGRLWPQGRYAFDPEAVAAAADHPLAGGEFRRLDADDVPALRALDERLADTWDLGMRRTEDWYRHRFFTSWRGDPFVYGWFRDDGALGGYLRYDVEEDEDDEATLRAWEVGAPDDAAVVNLLRFLHAHAAQVDRVRLVAPPDDLLFDLVEDPRAVRLRVAPGPMGRLVDVVAGLEALPAPGGVEASLALEVEDGLADWNDGAFALEASDGAFAVTPGAGDGPRAAMPIETLSRLAFGATTAERAAVAGGLEADEEAVEALAAVFPPREGYLKEFF